MNIKSIVKHQLRLTCDVGLEKSPIGVDNLVYVIRAGKQRLGVLKIFTKKTPGQVGKLYKLGLKLAEDRIPVPSFLRRPETIGDRPVLYTGFVQGRHATVLSTQQIRAAAKLMARLHRLKSITFLPIIKIATSDYLKLFRDCKKFKYIKNVEKIFSEISLDYLEKLKVGFIHGDFSLSNIFFNTKNQLMGLIDCDHSCNSYVLTDIARAQIFFAFDQNLKFREQKVLDFIKAYTKINPIKDEELRFFYRHMKVLLIKMILESYYYTKVKNDVSESVFRQSRFNQSPVVLYKKLLAIENREILDVAS